ncbi:MAG: proline--tRNA ligase [Gemmatimonas sp.]|nr:proline--tRNA ligase [Gemmatimonas sp.]
MADEKALTARAEDFSAWYNEVVVGAELADHSPVRGCMVIRPYGYRMWELVRDELDRKFRETGHQNAYFPLFIPQSFLSREADHIEGFAKEMAIVTHTRLKATGQAGAAALAPDPESRLDEPLIVRPTSETIIYAMFAKWVQSYRDLPLLINQWANVVRWEMRTRLFLRTTEFLWQEGHTAHATSDEAEQEARQMLDVYRSFMEQWMAMAVVTGRKSPSETFPGADHTYSCEAMMQDNRALQAGTSHHLGQNFSRQFDLKFAAESGEEEYAWNTSWGASTRLIGGLVMTHGDDRGLVLPPQLAPIQVVIVPIARKEEERAAVMEKVQQIVRALDGIRTHVDDRDNLTPGAKYYEWESKGVPFRIEVGPKDIAKGQLVLAKRVLAEGEERKRFLPEEEVLSTLPALLNEYQDWLLEQARERRERNSHRGVRDYDHLQEVIEGEGGFIYTGWCGSAACEARVKDDTKATIRVIPDPEFASEVRPSTCVVCGEASAEEVVWARAY